MRMVRITDCDERSEVQNARVRESVGERNLITQYREQEMKYEV